MSHDMPDNIYKASHNNDGAPTRILMITADKTEDLEFFYPYYRFIEAGYQVDVATPKGHFKGKMGYNLDETKTLEDVNPADYDLLYVPGGKAPEALKKEDRAVELVQKWCELDRPLAAVCHGPQLLAKADVIKGALIAAYPECEKEVEEAGATFVNQECCVDGKFITARWPGDLPAHLAETMKALHAQHSATRQAA